MEKQLDKDNPKRAAKELLVFNPMLYSDLEKYIWISDSYGEHRDAQNLFVNLLKKGIYVNGFATDKKSMFHLKMYNKKIYDINVLDKERCIVFCDTYFGGRDLKLPKDVHNVRILNPDMPKENIVIWGSGITGERVFKILSENGIKPECYVDSNKDFEGLNRDGLTVYAPEHLKKFAEYPTIVEAMEKWEELDAGIKELYESRFFFSFVCNNKKTIYNGRFIENMFNLMSWEGNFAFFIGKNVYVYGTGEVESELVRYLKLLDINFGGFLIDESDKVGEITSGSYDVKYIEEILYEKDYFVWIYDKRKIKRLEELGLICRESYLYYDGANNTSIEKKQILDTNLGHNYLLGSDYPGITVYGNDKENDYKIAVLGASTVGDKIFPFKSWPRLMYDELNNEGFKGITVYNGGIAGYTSGQDLLKLIRDMIPLKPNMIIVYDGLSDLSMCCTYPLTSGYVKKVFDFAKAHIENDEDDSFFVGGKSPICQGIEAKEDMFEAWKSNIRTMYAVARERNISFYSFCQPMLGSKKGKTETEKNVLLSVHSPRITNLMNGSFRERMSQMTELPKYMYDLSHILDDENDVYMDHCHVFEKGNRIIAREISKIILPELRSV